MKKTKQQWSYLSPMMLNHVKQGAVYLFIITPLLFLILKQPSFLSNVSQKKLASKETSLLFDTFESTLYCG